MAAALARSVDLKASHSNRDGPFTYLLTYSTLLASHKELLSVHRSTALRPELADGTTFFVQLRPGNGLQIAPGVLVSALLGLALNKGFPRFRNFSTR